MNVQLSIIQLKNKIIVLICKTISFFINFLHLGAGSTWPGHIALYFNKNFIKESFGKSRTKVILIAGTNGKTTTSTMLRFVLEQKGKKVFQNEEGANLLNGIASSIIKKSDYSGKSNYDFAIFESDENTLPLVLDEINPFVIILLNLFRDQLDRYGEVNTIALNWKKSFQKLDKRTTIVLNGDDPLIAFFGKNLRHGEFLFSTSVFYRRQSSIYLI